MKLSIRLTMILAAGYLVTSCANQGSTGNGAATTGSNPSAGAAQDVSGPGGTGPIDHGSTASGGSHGGGR